MSRNHTPSIPLRSVASPFINGGSNGQASSSVSEPPSAVYCILTPEETSSKLDTSLTHGLSAREASDRRAVHGPNEMPEADEESVYVRFFKQFVESSLILLLLGSAVVSFLMKNFDDGISITLAVLIVVSVGFVQEYRSEKSLEALNKLVPHYAHVIRGSRGSTEEDGGYPTSATMMAGQLVPGDLVSFATGDRIPADIRITQAAGLEIDESNLTGENKPVKKGVDAVSPRDALNPTLAEIPVSERACIAFMGTLVRSGNGHGVVIATGGKTEFGAISAMLKDIEKPRTPLQESMDALGKHLSYASFVVIGLIIFVGMWQGRGWMSLFQIGVSLAVAAIPEGLPIIVTVTLALGVLKMVKHGAIIRRLPSVETLGCVSVVCSDKTGTLTMNHMTVTQLWSPDMLKPAEKTDLLDNPDAAIKAVIKIGSMCNNARLSSTNAASVAASSVGLPDDSSAHSRYGGQPTDVALMDLLDASREDDAKPRLHKINEHPFSSAQKWMGVAFRGDDGGSGTLYVKGALEQVLSRCDTYLTKEGREVVLDDSKRKNAAAAAENMASEGLRVLGLATGTLPRSNGTATAIPHESEALYRGLAFAGLVGMYDPPRPGVQRAIRRLMRGSVKVMMITGDSDTTAVAIARKLGMPLVSPGVGSSSKPVLRGDEIDAMTEAQLTDAMATTTIFARTSPEHKMRIVRALQARGEVVAMTGDGVNDAPALKKADIGIAMGKHGTDVAKEAADMILSNDDFSTILKAIEEGKGIFYNIQNFLTFQLSTSVAALSLVLLSTIFRLPNPLNAMQILWINILMDGPPAQSLGVEAVDPIVMTRPPRKRNAPILIRPVIERLFTSAAIIVAGTMLVYIKEMASDEVVTARDTTMTFTAFVLFDMFNALTCRAEAKSVLRGEISLFGNKMFNFAVAASLLGQMLVIYAPPLQGIFQTEALSLSDLGLLTAMTSSVLLVDEARKFVKQQREQGWGYSGNV